MSLRARSLAWRGLVLAAAAWPACAAPGLPVRSPVSPALAGLEASIERCASSLDSLDIGYERIAERCPGLTAALEGSGYAPWLPADWKRPGNELSAAGLTQLGQLLQRELTGRAAPRVPDVRHLAPVLAQLPPVEASWEARLGAWLRGRSAPRTHSGERIWGWLVPAAPLPPAVGYALLVLAVLGAALLAARELRLWSVLGSVLGTVRWAVRGSGPRAVRPAHAVARLDPDDPAGDSTGRPHDPEKLGVLLAGVAARLAAQGRLPGSQSLTARELVRAAQLPPELLPQLATLAGVSEQLAFAPVPPPGTEIQAAARQGRQLLAQLDAGV